MRVVFLGTFCNFFKYGMSWTVSSDPANDTCCWCLFKSWAHCICHLVNHSQLVCCAVWI